MKLKILLFFSVLFTSLFALHTIVKSNSFGASPGNTGNPLDNSGATCNQFGCHSGSALNKPGGSVTAYLVTGADTVTSYTGGTSYTVYVKVKGNKTYGFEAAVFKHNVDSLVGTLSKTDNTAQVSGNYATHTAPKVSGLWKLKWIAPAKGTGAVDIYVAGNAANGDGNADAGDLIYNSHLSISEGSTGIDESANNVKQVKLYPNPAKDNISISYTIAGDGYTHLDLTDLNGKAIQTFYAAKQVPGAYNFNFKLNELPNGLYFVRITNSNSSHYEKLMIN